VLVVSDSHLSARTPEAVTNWDAVVDHVAAALAEHEGIGFITTYVPFLYGVVLGAVAGYFGGATTTLTFAPEAAVLFFGIWPDPLFDAARDVSSALPGLH
jgi:hypothetical protein